MFFVFTKISPALRKHKAGEINNFTHLFFSQQFHTSANKNIEIHIKTGENGRIDILVWWGNDTPRGIIEIKNQIFSNEQYEKDIKRIKGFLNRKSENSSIQFGIFSFYDSAEIGKKSAFHKIEDKIKKVTSNSREILGGEFTVKLFKTEIFEEVKDNAWAAACLLIMRKKITLPAGNAIRNSISK